MADNKITFFGKCDGISVEQLIRYSRFNMNVKHFHNQYEIFYIIEGERQFFFDNKSYNAYAGDIAILDTNLVHTTCSISDEDKGYNRVILYIDYERCVILTKSILVLILLITFIIIMAYTTSMKTSV